MASIPLPLKVQLPFGIISFEAFPEKARKFSDFPDGRIVVGNRDRGDVLFYKFDIENGLRGTYARNKGDQVTEAFVRIALADAYGIPEKSLMVQDMEDLLDRLKNAIEPPSLRGRPGSTQFMRGVSKSDRALQTVVFDLVLGRTVDFKMVGWREDMSPRAARDYYYSGTVEFAKKKYAFSLKPRYDWEWNTLARHTPIGSERVSAGLIRLSDHMSQHDAAFQMRYWLERYFPFINAYNMLGKFEFDQPITKIDNPQ